MESILSLGGVYRWESQGEEKRSDDHDHVDGVKDSLLEPRCVCR